jgi:hypothetical protein
MAEIQTGVVFAGFKNSVTLLFKRVYDIFRMVF